MSFVDQLQTLVARCRREIDSSEIVAQLAAIERRPSDPYRLYILGQLCRKLGRHDLWREAVETAFSLPHRAARQIFERGQAKLLLDDWSGWKDREVRLVNPEEPVWHLEYWQDVQWTKVACARSEDWSDQSIFIIADGDDAESIQMLRFIPVVARQASKVILGVSAPLMSFARYNVGGDGVTVTFRHIDHGLPFTRYAWLLSLPALCGMLPPFVPFAAPRVLPRLGANDSLLHIGSWLTRADSVHLTQGEGIQIHDMCDVRHSASYVELANRLTQFDWIIAPDGPIAHLAGSMGIPTMVLLDSDADVRWGAGATTPWYPSVQLIRQKEALNIALGQIRAVAPR